MRIARHGERIAIWVRWLLLTSCLAAAIYRPHVSTGRPIFPVLYSLAPIVVNGYAHHRILSNRTATSDWLLALSALDLVLISISVAGSGGFNSPFLRRDKE